MAFDSGITLVVTCSVVKEPVLGVALPIGVLLIDDAYTFKCRFIINEIRKATSWVIIKEMEIRNEFIIAEKID